MRAILLLLLLACCLTTNLEANEPGESRLAKVLIGRNESLRLKVLKPLRDDVREKLDALDDLIFALQANVERTHELGELSPSTIEMIDIVASANRPEALQCMTDLLDGERGDAAMLAADALGRYQRVESIDDLKMQVERPEWRTVYGFRFNLVRALVQMDHPDALEFLSQIKKTIDGQLLHELNKQLEDVTLDDFRGDEKRFELWKNGGKPESMFKAASYSDSPGGLKLQRQQYYGIDINAKRIMFIIDHSGSMKKRTYRGTRLTQAKAELMQAIRALPSDHEFAIVFYEERVREWRDELVYASDENKEDAMRFISKLQYGGSTNTYGALRRSLSFDDSLEAVFLLTDGKPSCGEIVAAPLIVGDIANRNRLRHLTINTIGIAINGTTQAFLETLAERCGGEYRAARQ